MFKQVNLQENISKDKYVLMKSSKVEFCEIDKGYITNINYSWHEPNTMDIQVPYHITDNGKKTINPLYDKFLGKGQYIKSNDEEKYVVIECDRTEDFTGKKVKTIKAKGAEIKLNDFDFYIPSGGLVRKLYKIENDIDVSDGILNLALADTRWTVKEVSDKARLEMNRIQEIYYKDLATSWSVNNVAKDTQLLAYGFTNNELKPLTDNVVQLNIVYKGMKSYIGEQLQKEETITHKLGEFHAGITRIVATYGGNDQYRYAVKYDITLDDGIVLERWHEFTYLDAMNITIDKVEASFTNGTEIETSYIKVRSFDEGVYNVYDFLKEVENAFGVKMIYDTINKQISCYTYDELGQDSSLFLSYENFIKQINKKSQYDEIVTKLYVESEQAGISEENPTGQDYILDYTYFRENGLMSDELISAYDRYLAISTGKQNDIATKRIDLNTLNKKKITLDTERRTLEEKIKGLQAIWSGYVKAGTSGEADANRIATEINGLQTQHAQNLTEAETVNQQIADRTNELKDIVDTVTMENATDAQGKIFTPELLDELSDITITDTLTDDYYTTSYSLYKHAVDVLTERNKLQIEFDTEVEGLLQNMVVPEGMTFDNILTLGNYVDMEDTEIDNGKLRLISFDYSPAQFKVSNFKFSNTDKDFLEESKMENTGRAIGRSNTYTSNYKSSWIAGKDVNNFVNSMLTDYLDTKTVAIRTRSGNNRFDMTEAGQFVVFNNNGNEDNQIYLGNGCIAITNDKWLTTRTCIDESGIYAQQIVGSLIAGQNLSIGNETNTMVIDGNGITIEGNKLIIKGTDGQNKDFNTQFQLLSDSINTKVSSGEDFNNQFGTQFTQTVNNFNFAIGNNNTNVTINKDGMNIKNGALTVQNGAGTVVIDGRYNIHKIINEGTATLSYTGQNKTVSIQHNLGYKPAFSAYQMGADGIDQYTQLPALTWSNGVVAIIRARADNNNIHFDFNVVSGYTQANINITIKYFIYQEVAF